MPLVEADQKDMPPYVRNVCPNTHGKIVSKLYFSYVLGTRATCNNMQYTI